MQVVSLGSVGQRHCLQTSGTLHSLLSMYTTPNQAQAQASEAAPVYFEIFNPIVVPLSDLTRPLKVTLSASTAFGSPSVQPAFSAQVQFVNSLFLPAQPSGICWHLNKKTPWRGVSNWLNSLPEGLRAQRPAILTRRLGSSWRIQIFLLNFLEFSGRSWLIGVW